MAGRLNQPSRVKDEGAKHCKLLLSRDKIRLESLTEGT